MRRFESPMLGIDITDREIRVVRVAARGGQPIVVQSSSTALTPGIVDQGIVRDPASASFALRRLLDGMKLPHGVSAVVGIPAEQTSVRFIQVPDCPDNELSALVEGELDHSGFHGVGRNRDFFVFSAPTDGSTTMRQVAVLSAESSTTEALAEVLVGAHVKVGAIEPAHLGLLRTAATAVLPQKSTFFLIICPAMTAASYFVEGRLVSIRRFDLGSGPLLRQTAYEMAAAAGSAPGRIDHAAIDRLAVEALQTIEYIQRENSEEISKVCIVSDEPDLEALAGMLERRLGIETHFWETPPRFPAPQFGTAFGLASRSFNGRFQIPRLDLFSNQRDRMVAEESRRNFRGAIMVACATLLIGFAGLFLYNRQIARFDKETHSLAADLADIRESTADILATRAKAKAQYATLQKEGVPLGPVMDSIVASLDSNIRLKTVSIDGERNLRVEGEAFDEAAIIRVARRLQSNPLLKNMQIDQFAHESGPESPLLFQMVGSTVGDDQVRETKVKS